MIYKKRSTRYGARKFKKTKGRKLYYSRRSAMRASIGKLRTHYFSRLSDSGSLFLGSNTTYQGVWGMALQGLHYMIDKATNSSDTHHGVINPNDFINLFDRYKILKVVTQFKWHMGVGADETFPISSKIENAPVLYYFRDYDNSDAPTSTELMERSDTKKVVLTPNRFVSIGLTPATLVDTGSGGTNIIKWKQWIDMANPSLAQHGLRFGILYPGNREYGRVTYQTRIYFACKNAR